MINTVAIILLILRMGLVRQKMFALHFGSKYIPQQCCFYRFEIFKRDFFLSNTNENIKNFLIYEEYSIWAKFDIVRFN